MERWEPIERLGPAGGVYVTDRHGFGVDALLLADFAAPRGRGAVCELGTGCGVMPLLWCGDKQLTGAPPQVTAVDIQPEAAELAARSVARNGLQAHIRVVCADWRRLEGLLPAGGFACVVCNPPYFSAGAGGVCEDAARRMARHEDGPDALDALCAAAARLLQNGGRFCLCHRPERLCDVVAALRRAGMEPKRLQLVQQTAESRPFLLLCEAKRGGKPGLHTEPTCVLRDADGYTAAARRLYRIET